MVIDFVGTVTRTVRRAGGAAPTGAPARAPTARETAVPAGAGVLAAGVQAWLPSSSATRSTARPPGCPRPGIIGRPPPLGRGPRPAPPPSGAAPRSARQWRHENEQHQALGARIGHAVRGAVRCQRRLVWPKLLLVVTDAHPRATFEHTIHLIRALVRVRLLLLPDLEAVHVGEEARRLKQIELLQAFRGKPARGKIGNLHGVAPS